MENQGSSRFDTPPAATEPAAVLRTMKILPLLLMPIASVAFLSNPSEPAVDAAKVEAVLDQPEVRAMVQQAQALIAPEEQPVRHGRNGGREIGLHTGHLQGATMQGATRMDSGARGLTPADEWREMFPRYAVNRSR